MLWQLAQARGRKLGHRLGLLELLGRVAGASRRQCPGHACSVGTTAQAHRFLAAVASGNLTICVSGPPDSWELARPYLELFGKGVDGVGDFTMDGVLSTDSSCRLSKRSRFPS